MPQQGQDQTQHPQQQQYLLYLKNIQQKSSPPGQSAEGRRDPWPRVRQSLLLNARLKRKQIFHITLSQEGEGCFVCTDTIGVAAAGETHPVAVATVQT